MFLCTCRNVCLLILILFADRRLFLSTFLFALVLFWQKKSKQRRWQQRSHFYVVGEKVDQTIHKICPSCSNSQVMAWATWISNTLPCYELSSHENTTLSTFCNGCSLSFCTKVLQWHLTVHDGVCYLLYQIFYCYNRSYMMPLHDLMNSLLIIRLPLAFYYLQLLISTFILFCQVVIVLFTTI